MGKKYIEENLEILRKQRDDKIKGSYREYVVKVYVYLRKGIQLSKTDFCNPKYSDMSKAIYGNRNEERKIRSFIKDLNKSGYISVYGVGEEKEIKILKELDF
jgi:murein L,D-transpeptidase YafK